MSPRISNRGDASPRPPRWRRPKAWEPPHQLWALLHQNFPLFQQISWLFRFAGLQLAISQAICATPDISDAPWHLFNFFFTGYRPQWHFTPPTFLEKLQPCCSILIPTFDSRPVFLERLCRAWWTRSQHSEKPPGKSCSACILTLHRYLAPSAVTRRAAIFP